MEEPLTIEQGPQPGELTLTGDLDLGTSGLLETAIDGLRAGGVTDVVLNTAGITFVDSRGLRSMLVALQGGSITLRRPSAQLLRLIDLTGLQEHLPVVE
ncbi:MAG: anti-sigma factor antagonist [Acidimicrobiales bacterium]|nr:anti-sigma factor antagonist [Acidimicrobiales bacterium]